MKILRLIVIGFILFGTAKAFGYGNTEAQKGISIIQTGVNSSLRNVAQVSNNDYGCNGLGNVKYKLEGQKDSIQIEVEVEYQAGWNLIGIPVELPYYPDPPWWIPELYYTFDSNGYVLASSLELGKGYFHFFNEYMVVQLIGYVVDNITINLYEGWNLIAGISYPVAVNTILDPYELIASGTIYGYGSLGYFNAETIDPGYGYWLRSYGAGEITISNSTSTSRLLVLQPPENANTLTINGQTLYFGVEIPEEEKLSYSLPPKPPSGAGDVRFAGDWKYCGDYGKIEVMNHGETLLIVYAVKDGEGWLLSNSITGDEYALRGIGEIEVSGKTEKFTLKKQGEINLPDAYALHHNYPNPFNPITTITYDLPELSDVHLAVYDLMGREMVKLVSDELAGGAHHTVWNGLDKFGKPVSSGVYIYRITAVSKETDQRFMQNRKLIILK